MRFALSDEQEQLRDAIRRSLADLEPDDRGSDRWSSDADAWQRSARDRGLVGLGAPVEVGGQGAGTLEVMLLMHEVGRALATGPFLGTVALALPLLVGLGDEGHRRRWIPDIVGGGQVATLALHEQRTGDALQPAATVRADGEKLLLSGRKRGVPDADRATTFLVVARREAGEQAAPGDVGVFVVPRSEEVTVTDGASIDLTRTYGRVDFAGAACEPLWTGSDPAPLRRCLDVTDILVAGELVGAAERCLELSVEHARTRYQFGRPIGSFQATKHRCVDMFVELELARAAVEHAAWTVDGRPDQLAATAPTALAAAISAAVFVSQEAIHVHGGLGFTWEHDLHRYLRRIRALGALVGDRDEQLRAIVRRQGWVADPSGART